MTSTTEAPTTDEVSEPAPPRRAPCVLAATLTTLVVACATFAAAALLLWGSAPATLLAIDFNGALFEDFFGPYWMTATALAEGGSRPAPGYLYPSTLAWLLAPITIATPADNAFIPSMLALWSVGLSLTLWVASVTALLRPSSFRVAAAAGLALGLAHAPVHGAYWAQASLPAIGLLAAGIALITTGRPTLAGAAIGLGAALKLHPAIGVVALLIPWRGGSSLRGLAGALGSALALGVLLPLTLMGRAAFMEFHRTSFGFLTDIRNWVLTEEGGRGAQDLPTVFRRAVPMQSPWLSQVIGWAAAGALLIGGIMVLRRVQVQRPVGSPARDLAPLLGFIALAAIPWATISPTWPHGLLWVPAAWWCACHHGSALGRGLAALSFACGSIAALRAFGSPEAYAWYGLPAWSAGLALAAALPAWKSVALR